MIEILISLLLQLSVLQSDGVKDPASVKENQSTTQSTGSKPITTRKIGSGGWDDRN